MILSLEKNELKKYLMHQTDNVFPDGSTRKEFSDGKFELAFEEALQRAEKCFSHIKVRNYQKDGNPCLSHLHLDQYTTFLYYISNSLWKMSASKTLCDKLGLLSRSLSSCWISYKCALPDIFLLTHPVGTVIGNSNVQYSDFLVIMQNVTINGASGSSLKIGKGVFFGAGCKIIQGGGIGSRCSVGANTLLRNPNVPDDSIVYRDVNTGEVVIRHSRKECAAQKYFYDDLSIL